MINSFYGKLVFKSDSEIYLQNINGCCEIYFENNNDFKIGNEYFFYYFNYQVWNNKNINTSINVGFLNLIEAINFKELILINGIGIKTALKIINSGINNFKKIALNEDIDYISKNFHVSENIAKNIIKHYQGKEINNLNPNDNIKILSAINNLEQLGYKKELVKKIVLNRKQEIIDNNFNDIFSLLIMDIKNERTKSKTK